MKRLHPQLLLLSVVSCTSHGSAERGVTGTLDTFQFSRQGIEAIAVSAEGRTHRTAIDRDGRFHLVLEDGRYTIRFATASSVPGTYDAFAELVVDGGTRRFFRVDGDASIDLGRIAIVGTSRQALDADDDSDSDTDADSDSDSDSSDQTDDDVDQVCAPLNSGGMTEVEAENDPADMEADTDSDSESDSDGVASDVDTDSDDADSDSDSDCDSDSDTDGDSADVDSDDADTDVDSDSDGDCNAGDDMDDACEDPDGDNDGDGVPNDVDPDPNGLSCTTDADCTDGGSCMNGTCVRV
jgi:hypothetical protein